MVNELYGALPITQLGIRTHQGDECHDVWLHTCCVHVIKDLLNLHSSIVPHRMVRSMKHQTGGHTHCVCDLQTTVPVRKKQHIIVAQIILTLDSAVGSPKSIVQASMIASRLQQPC